MICWDDVGFPPRACSAAEALFSSAEPWCWAHSRGNAQQFTEVHGMMPSQGWQEFNIVLYSLPVSRLISIGIQKSVNVENLHLPSFQEGSKLSWEKINGFIFSVNILQMAWATDYHWQWAWQIQKKDVLSTTLGRMGVKSSRRQGFLWSSHALAGWGVSLSAPKLSFPGPAIAGGSKALPCFHPLWWKGSTYLSLGADQPTDNGDCPVFFPLELLLAGRMLETGAELAVQALVVGSLLRCTEKPWGSLRWARLFYPFTLRTLGIEFPFGPPGPAAEAGQGAGISCFSRELGKFREGSGGIMCPLGTFCPLQRNICVSEMPASSPTAGIRAAVGTRLTADFALVFKIPLFTFLRNAPIKAVEHEPSRKLKTFI